MKTNRPRVVEEDAADAVAETFLVAWRRLKQRPVVATAVGGIVDQIEDGVHGLLVDDPADLQAFGAAVELLLRDPEYAARLAENACRRVIDEFLGDRHLEQYGLLFEQLVRESS